jgi:phytanoyl-CoA hydroxylase
MPSTHSLSTQQVSFFRDAGYLRLGGVIDDELRRQLLARVLALQADDNHPERKIYGIFEHASTLILTLLRRALLLDALVSLLGPNVVMVLNRHNTAAVNPPGVAPRMHRDVLHWSRAVVTAIVYLEQATVDSGCTMIIPTSQRWPLVGVTQPHGGGTWMDEHDIFSDVGEQGVPVPMPAGGVLLLDSLAFHTIGPNASQQSRVSLTFGFHSADELDRHPDEKRQVIVAGSFIYRGNDLGR